MNRGHVLTAHPFRVLVSLATTLIATAGCAGSSSSITPSATVAPSVIEVARLLPMPAGTATISRNPNSGRIAIDFDVYGMALRSSHAVVLRSGICSSSGDQNVAVFPDLVANAYGAVKGTITSRSTVAILPTRSHLEIKLGRAADAIHAPVSTLIACADITRATLRTPLTLTPLPGQRPSGTVTLAYVSSGRLAIHVVVSGLMPGSIHAGHVHFGSCRQQSGVLYTLGNVNADAHGNVNSVITLTGITTPPPAHGWYADLHLAPVGGLEVNGQPALFFQPLLCGDVR
jgi:hypothetical protein